MPDDQSERTLGIPWEPPLPRSTRYVGSTVQQIDSAFREAVASVFKPKPKPPEEPSEPIDRWVDQAYRGDVEAAVDLLLTWQSNAEPAVCKSLTAFTKRALREYIEQRIRAKAKGRR